MTTVNAIMPNLGTNMEKGTITKWIKKEGDKIVKGEPLFEIMTEKVVMEIESPASGVLSKILVQEGSTVPVTETVAIIETL